MGNCKKKKKLAHKFTQTPLSPLFVGVNERYLYSAVVDSAFKNFIQAEDGFVVVAYNPLAQRRSGYVDVPLSWPSARVTDSAGNTVESQVLPFRHRNVFVARDGLVDGGGGGRHPNTLVLPITEADPLGVRVLHVSRENGRSSHRRRRTWRADANHHQNAAREEATALDTGDREEAPDALVLPSEQRGRQMSTVDGGVNVGVVAGDGGGGHHAGASEGSAPGRSREESEGKDVSISNGLVTLTFDGATGRLSTVETHEDGAGGGVGVGGRRGAKLDVDQGWFFYPTFDGGNGAQSGVSERTRGSSGKAAAVEASRLHQELPERVGASEEQQGGAYIFRPEEADGVALPVGMGGAKGEGEGLAVKDWWVEEGPLVSEVHQVSVEGVRHKRT